MKYNSRLYLISLFPLFNPGRAPVFDSMDIDHSLYLYSTLLLNNLEVFGKIKSTAELIYCFDEADSEYIKKETSLPEESTLFFDSSKSQELLTFLADKFFGSVSNNLIIFSNTIGVSPVNLDRIFNMLSIEDESVVIGKTSEDRTAFIGFNEYKSEILENIISKGTNFNKLLASVNKYDIFVHVVSGNLLVENISDFRKLYTELSKKESWAYCGQEKHERFTHLFVEYKELLK